MYNVFRRCPSSNILKLLFQYFLSFSILVIFILKKKECIDPKKNTIIVLANVEILVNCSFIHVIKDDSKIYTLHDC